MGDANGHLRTTPQHQSIRQTAWHKPCALRWDCFKALGRIFSGGPPARRKACRRQHAKTMAAARTGAQLTVARAQRGEGTGVVVVAAEV